jgi:hypothetical protein
VIRAEDNRIVGPSELASAVEPGMKLEMSILLWKATAFLDKGKCPRCRHINLDVTVDHGWIQWKVPLIVCVRLPINTVTVVVNVQDSFKLQKPS